MNSKRFLKSLLFGCLLLSWTGQAVAGEPLVERYLVNGELNKGEKDLQRYLVDNPDDEQVRFGLGTLQFMQSLEHMGKSLYKHGSSHVVEFVPFVRFPVPNNPDPEPITYDQAREILETFVRDLEKADRTLARVTDRDVKLPLHIFKFSMDWNENGKIEKKEGLARIYARYLGNNFNNSSMYRDKIVVFDKADVHWLRGYCSLLRGMGEFLLAYDQRAIWDVSAHRFFPKAKVKYQFLTEEGAAGTWMDQKFISDVIAGVHNMNMPLKDAEGVARARQHFLDMIHQSRLMWHAVERETDDDQEWIPSSTQKAAVTNFVVTKEMIKTWRRFLDEAENILNGDVLVPFWRGTKPDRGVNIYKFTTHPRNFDLVMWVHGSAAAPYLENGTVSDADTWRRFQNVFRGDFFGFAVWVN